MALLLRANGSIETIYPNNFKSFSLAELQQCVGGYIEHLDLQNGAHLFFNEEGKLQDLSKNTIASAVAHSVIDVDDYIVGNAVLCTSTEAGMEDDGDGYK